MNVEPGLAGEDRGLLAVLERARNLGFLGAGPLEAQIEHAGRFWTAAVGGWDAPGEPLLADLGAGGGLPGLALAVGRPELRLVLVEASRKRASFLVWATVELGLAGRCEVWCGRAEEAGHDPRRRGRFDLVVARGFGPLPSTLECGGPLLRLGGRLVVSEPPGYRSYPGAAVARCGLALVAQRDGCAVLDKVGEPEPVLPRRWRDQQRRPLFPA